MFHFFVQKQKHLYTQKMKKKKKNFQTNKSKTMFLKNPGWVVWSSFLKKENKKKIDVKKHLYLLYRERYNGIISSIIDAQYLELLFLLSGKLQKSSRYDTIFLSLKTSSFYIYRFTYIPCMLLNHVEVYFEYEHARDIVGTWMFSLNIDTLYVIVTLRTIVSTGICKYGQLFFELKRFISFYWRIS